MSYVERIARAGIIPIIATIFFRQLVIGDIIDSPHGESRAQLVSLRGVVVYDIENDFDPGLMQSRHHHLELVHSVQLDMRGGVPAGRGKIPKVLYPQ